MLITDAAWEWVVFFSHDLYDISIWSHVASEIGFEETRMFNHIKHNACDRRVFINTAKRLYIVKNPEAAVTGKVVEEELLISSSQVMFSGCFMYKGGESNSSWTTWTTIELFFIMLSCIRWQIEVWWCWSKRFYLSEIKKCNKPITHDLWICDTWIYGNASNKSYWLSMLSIKLYHNITIIFCFD